MYMKFYKVGLLCVIPLLVANVFASAVQITDVKATPISPWAVQIDYRVVGGISGYYYPGLNISNTVTRQVTCANEDAIDGDFKLTEGRHSIRWNMMKDNVKWDRNNVVFTILTAKYCVIDLSNGDNAMSYPGLTNIQNGHGNSEYGCASVAQIQKMYEAEEAEIPALKYLIIKIKQSTIDERGSVYEAVRMHWHINEKQAKGRIVLASVAGIIRGVFTVQDWLPSTECEGRMYFVGQEASNEVKNLFIGKRLPKKFIKKGAASPVRYS